MRVRAERAAAGAAVVALAVGLSVRHPAAAQESPVRSATYTHPDGSPAALPVVLVHGFGSASDIWRGTEILLRDQGFEPIPVDWRPEPGLRAPQTATRVLLPRIREALRARGYPDDAPFAAVGHSMGGLMLRWLAEQSAADADRPREDGSWEGDGQPDGDPAFGARLQSLVMISTPQRGARTGIARIACDSFRDPDWRKLGCDLVPGAPFLRALGAARPADAHARYLAIGVDTAAFLLPPMLWDGNGDGRAMGHDNAVMTESARLDGAPFSVWRGWGTDDHFHVTCSAEVNRWIVGFLRDAELPADRRGRRNGGNLCPEPANSGAGGGRPG